MSLIAGLFAFSNQARLPEAISGVLAGAMSRRSDEEVRLYTSERAVLAKVDLHAFEGEGWREEDGAVSLLAGEPLLEGSHELGASRADDLAILHSELPRNPGPLGRARGVFALARYDPQLGQLLLATDALGVRPLYWLERDGVLTFASALRIIEALQKPALVMDSRAVTEIVALGYPLSDRTPYDGVRMLGAGALLEVSSGGLRHRRYCRWNTVQEQQDVDATATEAFRVFETGVRRRLRGRRTATAFLSGGLDSRCVVTALIDAGADVHTVNFSPPNSQDQVLARLFAARAGTRHEEFDRPAAPRWSALMAEALASSSVGHDSSSEGKGVVWSGDGGSVGVGHVYLHPAIVDHMRGQRRAEAVMEFLRRSASSVPARLLTGRARRALGTTVVDGILEELERTPTEDPARAFLIFLLENDQRRHLSLHFENLDLHRLEYQLPFFDWPLLRLVMSVPLDQALGHRFYMRWFDRFPSVARSVPWQAYPGHVPCPLPLPEDLSYQWGRDERNGSRAQRQQVVDQVRDVLSDVKGFPDALLRRSVLRVAALAHRLGLRDCTHVLRAGRIYYEHWNRSGGRYTLGN